MAIQNVIEFLETELVKLKRQGYQSLRSSQHMAYDTSIIFIPSAIKKAVIGVIGAEYVKQGAKGLTSTQKEDIGREFNKHWGTVFTQANVITLAQKHFRARGTYAGVHSTEAALKKDMAARKKSGGIWVETKGKEVHVHFLNSYRFTASTKFAGHGTNNAGMFTNVALAEITVEVVQGLVAKGKAVKGGKMDKTFSGKSSPRTSAYSAVSTSGVPTQHHITKDGSEVVGGSGFADALSGVTAGNITAAMQMGKGGKLNPAFTGTTIVSKDIVQGLTAEFDVLTWDKKTHQFVIKQDDIKLVVGDKNDKQYSPNKHDLKELDAILTNLENKLIAQYLGNPGFKTSKKSPIKNIQDAALAGSVLTVANKLKKQKGIKVTHNLQDEAKDHKIRQKKKGKKLNLINSKEGRPHLKKYVGKKVAATTAMKSRVQGKAGVSPIALRTLLNTLLPRAVASKMVGGKTLAFRTGRFAGSAEVGRVVKGAKGGMQIDYTYMKYPYQTFEPGFAQGSTFRDPRLLIGQSIRELATQIMGQKFTGTVRRI